MTTDEEVQEIVQGVLVKVESIEDLTRVHTHQLTPANAKRFAIEKFLVQSPQFWYWRQHDTFNGKGIEYDARLRRIIVKTTDNEIYKSLAQIFERGFAGIAETVRRDPAEATHSVKSLKGVELKSQFGKHRKEVDVGIYEGRNKFPVVAVEIGVWESKEKLIEETNKLLEGSSGTTRTVIVVRFDEQEIPETPMRTKLLAYTQWALKSEKLLAFTTDELAHLILDWHDGTNVPLVGNFVVHMYICRRNHIPRKVYRCNFIEQYGLDQVRFRSKVLIFITEHGIMGAEHRDRHAEIDSENEEQYIGQDLEVEGGKGGKGFICPWNKLRMGFKVSVTGI